MRQQARTRLTHFPLHPPTRFASKPAFIHPRCLTAELFPVATKFPLSLRSNPFGRRHADRPSPRLIGRCPQVCASSKIPSFHVAHVVHSPLQARTTSLLGRSQALCSYVPLFPFRSRSAALHSSISPFTLAFYQRTSPLLPGPRRLWARCRAGGYDPVNFLHFGRRFPSSSSLAGRLALAFLLFSLPLDSTCT